MISRGRFVGAAAAAVAALPLGGRAQDDADPAHTSGAPALRVLLGAGEANPTGQGFVFNGQPYRGAFRRLPDGSIVNDIGLEEYLYSVVPHEMSPSWPGAALQAQAICARTYVLQRSNPRRDYDLTPSEADQVYSGVLAESPAGTAAVDATQSQVLRYDGAFASIAYSSCCGGHTEASSDAWSARPTAYLMGVPCAWCTASPNYRWATSIDLDAVERAFDSELAPYGVLRGVRITATDPSGRARAFALDAEHGAATVKGSAFRLAVGPRVLRSLLIASLTQANGSVLIEGFGLGHGVGLCQWGARGLALAGKNADDILITYFPGTQIGHD